MARLGGSLGGSEPSPEPSADRAEPAGTPLVSWDCLSDRAPAVSQEALGERWRNTRQAWGCSAAGSHGGRVRKQEKMNLSSKNAEVTGTDAVFKSSVQDMPRSDTSAVQVSPRPPGPSNSLKDSHGAVLTAAGCYSRGDR